MTRTGAATQLVQDGHDFAAKKRLVGMCGIDAEQEKDDHAETKTHLHVLSLSGVGSIPLIKQLYRKKVSNRAAATPEKAKNLLPSWKRMRRHEESVAYASSSVVNFFHNCCPCLQT